MYKKTKTNVHVVTRNKINVQVKIVNIVNSNDFPHILLASSDTVLTLHRDLSHCSKGRCWQNNSHSSYTSSSFSTIKILPSYGLPLPDPFCAGVNGHVMVWLIVWVSHQDPYVGRLGSAKTYRLIAANGLMVEITLLQCLQCRPSAGGLVTEAQSSSTSLFLGICRLPSKCVTPSLAIIRLRGLSEINPLPIGSISGKEAQS